MEAKPMRSQWRKKQCIRSYVGGYSYNIQEKNPLHSSPVLRTSVRTFKSNRLLCVVGEITRQESILFVTW